MSRTFLTPIDLAKNELQNARIQNLSTAPSSPVLGQIYYDTDDNLIYVWVGSWASLSTGGTSLTQENVEDIVGALIQDSATLDWTYSDATPSLTATIITGSVTNAMLAGSIANSKLATNPLDTDNHVDGTTNHVFTAADDTKLTGVATGATANSSDATLLARANHTGTQAISTILAAATSRIFGRITASGGAGEELTAANVKTILALAPADVTFAATARFLGRNTASGGPGEEVTMAQAKTLLAIVAADLSDFNTAVRTNRLDQMAAPTAPVALGAQKITGLADGTASTDAATFGQVSAAVQGFEWKAAARIVLTANDTLSGLTARDGVTPVAGDRVLAAAQTSAPASGIYIAAAGAWARATDMDVAAEANNATVFIEAGTLGAGDVWTQTATIVTIGTTSMVWTKVSDNVVYTADGTTLTLTGTSFGVTNAGITATQLAASVAGNGLTGGAGTALAVGGTASRISVAADAIDIDSGYVGQTSITTLGTIATGTWSGTAIAVAKGGTGATDAATARTNLAVPSKYAATITGTTTTEVITHNLATRDVVVSVHDITTFVEVECDVTKTSTNTITLGFAVAPAAGAYRVIVVG